MCSKCDFPSNASGSKQNISNLPMERDISSLLLQAHCALNFMILFSALLLHCMSRSRISCPRRTISLYVSYKIKIAEIFKRYSLRGLIRDRIEGLEYLVPESAQISRLRFPHSESLVSCSGFNFPSTPWC
jgi:hypothetical protein